MSAEHRDSYRKPTPEEARRFAEIDRSWRKWRRRQRTRYAVQLAAAIILALAIVTAAVVTVWAIVVGLTVALGGIPTIL
jgi:hypothetical protein